MKRTLRPFLAASVILNVVAGAWALHKQLSAHEERIEAQPMAASIPLETSAAPSPKPVLTQSAATATPSQASDFRWSELEDQNFETYISRLRKIGCPESTIKTIVVGELQAQSGERRAELERRILRSGDWSPPPGISRQEYLAAQLRKLDREIDTAANSLLRSASTAGSPASVAGTVEDSPPPARYPVVLEDVSFQSPASGDTPSKALNYVSPGVVEASPEVVASIQEIQNGFVQDIGGPNQDVEDPQYESNWRTAQWKADQILRARYGWAAYNDMVRAAVLKALEAQRTTGE